MKESYRSPYDPVFYFECLVFDLGEEIEDVAELRDLLTELIADFNKWGVILREVLLHLAQHTHALFERVLDVRHVELVQ